VHGELAPDSSAAPLNLEQLRKRAKDLRKAHAAGDPDALERVRAQRSAGGPLAAQRAAHPPLRLSEAQLVVAREAGFASWSRARRAIEQQSGTEAEAEADLIRAALAGDTGAVAAVLERRPELPGPSFCAALVLADEAAVATALSRTPELATSRSGPRQWPALLYLCSSRWRAGAPGETAARVRIARALLERGASPDVGTDEMDESLRCYRTALGSAIGWARSPELARVLLEAGADRADGPALYEGCAMWHAVRLRDWTSLRVLLDAGPPHWHANHALPQCLEAGSAEPVRLLLERGADPNWTMGRWGFGGGSLHEALAIGCSPEILVLLIEAGAQLELRDRDGRTALASAVRFADGAAAALLRERGAREEEVSDVDHWLGACFREDEREASARLRAQPRLAAELVRSDHQCVARAVRRGRREAVRLLLAGGARPDVADDDGETALHLAAARGAAELCAALALHGASLRARNFDDRTPFECALEHADPAAREATCERLRAAARRESLDERELEEQTVSAARAARAARAELFERAADAIAAGDVDTLRALLERDPELARARSARPHRATLLHYIGANGVEVERQRTPPSAVEIAQLLLERGSDPNALCLTYRGGPEQTALGLLTSSDPPLRAGLMLPLVQTLARAGARLSGAYALLLALAETRGAAAASPPAFDPAARAAQQALAEAARLGELDLARALLDRGVAVNAAPERGTTALHVAAFHGRSELVELLLERGADATARDAVFGGTAAGWAHAGGHPELAERLEVTARE
jgi:ankyrin repeat protein